MRRRKESLTLLPLSPLLLDLFVCTSLLTQPRLEHTGENVDEWEVEAVGQQLRTKESRTVSSHTIKL
jgi:hypothetical protein